MQLAVISPFTSDYIIVLEHNENVGRGPREWRECVAAFKTPQGVLDSEYLADRPAWTWMSGYTRIYPLVFKSKFTSVIT